MSSKRIEILKKSLKSLRKATNSLKIFLKGLAATVALLQWPIRPWSDRIFEVTFSHKPVKNAINLKMN
jgi:hypothetical protein